MARPHDKENSQRDPPNSPAENRASGASLASATPEELAGMLRDSRVDEKDLLLVLSRNDLPARLIDELGKRRDSLKSARVLYALASHRHTPHLLAMRVLRNLYIMDLLRLSLSTAAAPTIRAAAEEALIAKLPQLPLGQKISLARQASARVLAELLVSGQPRLVRVVLDSPRLTESSVLKALSREKIAHTTLTTISNDPRWAAFANVRIALLQRPEISRSVAAKLLAACSKAQLKTLLESNRISVELRREILEILPR